jgi:fructokinase
MDARPTPLAFVMRGTAQTGSRYSFYLDATAFDGRWPFPPTWPTGATHLHIGSIAAVEARHTGGVLDALGMARSFATTSFDPNIRPMVTPDRASVLETVERQVALASVVKASDEDLEWLYPGRDAEESIAHWATLGPLFTVVTCGSKGAVAFMKGERLFAAAPKVDVVDTVGAGDSFMSALLAAMHSDGALGIGAAEPNSASLARWLKFAATASAITCSRKGSNPPTRADVEARLAIG